MFVERLSEENIKEFLKANIKMDIEQIEMLGDKVYVRLGFDVAATGSQHVVEYVFTDFTCEGQNLFAKMAQDVVQQKWIEFMENKFDKVSSNPKAHKQYTKAKLAYLQSGKDK
ncbi:MAG: hypothetical protein E7376_05075 [Clostridiales bacterium]|nr:hypothetical protein [Clostridiales bacterium]